MLSVKNNEQQFFTLLYIYSKCIDKMKCWIWYFVYFLKQYFSINWTDLISFDIVYMILKIDIHRYTDEDASVLSLKKRPKENKQRKDLLTYLRYFSWLLRYFSWYFSWLSIASCKMFVITFYGILSQWNEFCLLKCTKCM